MNEAHENIQKVGVYFEKIAVEGWLENTLDQFTKNSLKVNEGIDLSKYHQMNKEAVMPTEMDYGRVDFQTYKALLTQWFLDNNWEDYLRKLKEESPFVEKITEK